MFHHQARASVSTVRQRARGAVLYASIGIDEIPAALRPESVKRAIAKQAVELTRGNALMTGEVRA